MYPGGDLRSFGIRDEMMKPRILVIDDDLLVLKAIERNLRRSYDVVAAIDVESAEEYLDDGPFDAIICDYHLSEHCTPMEEHPKLPKFH